MLERDGRYSALAIIPLSPAPRTVSIGITQKGNLR
jgi:hypothetical protein